VKHVLATLGILALATPVAGEPVQFSTVLRGELGYGTNPFLRQGVTRGAALASVGIAPRLTKRTARSSTTLSGNYTRDQYINSLGYTDAASVGLARTDQLTQHLSSVVTAGLSTSNRAILYDTDEVVVEDPLNIGRRTRHENASIQMQWQASAKDQLNYGANISHLSYGSRRSNVGAIGSGYTQHGANVGYNHVIDARTSVGAQVSVTTVHSKLYPDSRAIQPSLTGRRQLTAIWNVTGHVGLVSQRIFGPFGGSNSSLGYGATLCGVYPRTSLCLYADRGSQASGYGGLRTSDQFRATLSHDLAEHDRVSLSAGYNRSQSIGSPALRAASIRSVKAIHADAEYNHDLTQRVSAGVGARYRSRDTANFGSARSVTATVHITAKLGNI
jgi:hypothetical protein